MPKASRFRNRKINFKTRIPVKIGHLDIPADPAPFDDAGSDICTATDIKEGANTADAPNRVETGVDKEDESEYHLQVAINASLASLRNRIETTSGVSPVGPSSEPINLPPKPPAPSRVPHIPTPDARQTVSSELYDSLYATRFSEPNSYVKFSDTVEDAIGEHGQPAAVNYTMDEEDEDWLESWNAGWDDEGRPKEGEDGAHVRAMAKQAKLTTGGSLPGFPNNLLLGMARSSPRGKAKEVLPPSTMGMCWGKIAENDFELVMEQFEAATEAMVPLLHTDVSKLPTFADLEPTFIASHDVKIHSLRSLARLIYPHWKSRKEGRGGKNIIPQLNFDESNENNPYVCFRRRDVKTVRKTRRSDLQNVERLSRLRADLFFAKGLMIKILEREQHKQAGLTSEFEIFEARCQLRALKRLAGEAKGDEELLFSRRDKKRKRAPDDVDGEAAQQARKPTAPEPPKPGKKPTTTTQTLPPPVVVTPVDILPSSAQTEKMTRIKQAIDHDKERSREAALSWVDVGDSNGVSSHPNGIAASSSRSARPDSCHGWIAAPSQATPWKYRRRIGRGGRVFVDRTQAPRPESPKSKTSSRFAFDSALPSFDSAGDTMDDFDTASLASRCRLVSADNRLFDSDSAYLNEAARWASKPPEKPPELEIVGSLPKPHIPPHGFLSTPPGANPMQMAHLLARALPNGQKVSNPNQLAAAHHLSVLQNSQGMRRTVSMQPTPFPNGQGDPQHWGMMGQMPPGVISKRDASGPQLQQLQAHLSRNIPNATLPLGLHLARNGIVLNPQSYSSPPVPRIPSLAMTQGSTPAIKAQTNGISAAPGDPAMQSAQNPKLPNHSDPGPITTSIPP